MKFDADKFQSDVYSYMSQQSVPAEYKAMFDECDSDFKTITSATSTLANAWNLVCYALRLPLSHVTNELELSYKLNFQIFNIFMDCSSSRRVRR
jgi:hypothetical protein